MLQKRTWFWSPKIYENWAERKAPSPLQNNNPIQAQHFQWLLCNTLSPLTTSFQSANKSWTTAGARKIETESDRNVATLKRSRAAFGAELQYEVSSPWQQAIINDTRILVLRCRRVAAVEGNRVRGARWRSWWRFHRWKWKKTTCVWRCWLLLLTPPI